MFNIADRLDRHLISIVDGFCSHLQVQLRIPFGWMISIITLGTGLICFIGSMLMFAAGDPQRLFFIVIWAIAFAGMVLFLERALWRRIRNWPSEDVVIHWAGMGLMMRENGRILRFVAIGGTILLLPGAIAPLFSANPEIGMQSLKFLFVTMVPVTLMMYVFCSLPRPTK